MHTADSSRITASGGVALTGLPVLGLGVSCDIEQALDLASGKLNQDEEYQLLNFLNVGLTASSVIPRDFARTLSRAELRSVAHLQELNLVTDMAESRLRAIATRAQELGCEWLQQDVGLWEWNELPLLAHILPAFFAEDSLRRVCANVQRVMECTEMVFLAENAPVYISVEEMDMLTFLAEVAHRTGCGLILDIGHFVGYCAATGRDPIPYLRTWTAGDRVVEVHLAGYSIFDTPDGPLWLDRHSLPIPAQGFEVLAATLELCRNVKAVTLEQDGAPPAVLRRNLRVAAQLLSIQ